MCPGSPIARRGFFGVLHTRDVFMSPEEKKGSAVTLDGVFYIRFTLTVTNASSVVVVVVVVVLFCFVFQIDIKSTEYFITNPGFRDLIFFFSSC